MKKPIVILSVMILMLLTVLGGCAPKKGATYKWEVKNEKYVNFTDLGDYVIDVDEHKNFNLEKALEYSNARYDKWKQIGGCSALGTKTNKGDVIIGRNLDLTVSQFPCYVTHVNSFKYKTINFTYDELFMAGDTYEKLLNKESKKIEDEYYNALPILAADSFNDQGLYVEYNMRAYEEYMICSGTNPSATTKVCTISLPFMITTHCATVKEALEYIKTDLNIYTMLDESVASGWNLCFMIGDATGEYGLIEIANNEISYLPYQHGQGNYYITPKWNVLSKWQSGYGRLQFGLERINTVQSDEDMSNLMEQIMWRNEILNIPYAENKNGHIIFQDENGNPSLDWRSDNVKLIPVNAEGKYVNIYAETLSPEAEQVKIYKEAYDNYRKTQNPEYKENADKYTEYLNRSNLYWASDDNNFDELQKGLIDYYTNSGILEKLDKYYSGEEKPLRDDSNVWTTALSITANCTQKRITVRFWEKPNTIMTWQF